MTSADLQQIIDTAAKATPGPEWCRMGQRVLADVCDELIVVADARSIEDARYIANCDPQTVAALARIALAAVALRQEIDDDGYPRVYGDTSHGHGVGGQTMCSAFPDVLMRLDSALRDAELIK